MTAVAVNAKTLSGEPVRSEAVLTISRAKTSEWDNIGEALYNNGDMSSSMHSAMVADDQGSCPQGLNIDLPKATACGNCHSPTSMFTIEHTPTQTAGYSNEDLVEIFTRAAKPAGGFKSAFLRTAPRPDCVFKEIHSWEMTVEEQKGIVWKLRSIAPKAHEEQ